MSYPSVLKVPEPERPRERCLLKGARSLSFRECLALVLGTSGMDQGAFGLAGQILNRPGPGLPPLEQERAFFTGMECATQAHLSELRGLGPAGRARLLATFEIARRYSIYRQGTGAARGLTDPNPDEVALAALERICPELRMESREWIGFITVHRSGALGLLCIVEHGVRTHVNVDPAELFARLLALRPRGFFLVHNHPSGDPRPSPQDFDLTDRVREIAGKLGIECLGHWIVSPKDEIFLDPPSRRSRRSG